MIEGQQQAHNSYSIFSVGSFARYEVMIHRSS